ncbi:glycosyl hydrolase [Cellulomonas sp. KRMCY2]|uniref:glycosyl hydrolase n=1 Tax=Cellulomonas sp. KRMCY2 TaxID=1304865 RepID=UPI00045EB903|nr:glycosyl hydrolase [Cellulomonas sp. KRMCY2]
MKNRTMARGRTNALRALTASLGVVTVSSLTGLPTVAAPADDPAAPADTPIAAAETLQIVDPQASASTLSLFSYLRDVRGEGILFGHQHTTSYGVSIGAADGTQSDVNNGVGDFPAVFGWDTLIIEGRERPGVAENTRAQNIAVLADYIEKADAIGGINTISAHMENFVTGGSFYDTTGDTLRAVLPGGDKNDELRAYLDDIALLADSVEDANGDPIPVIFRPWHENAGSWFWWGAAYGSPGEYQELYRFTVEYLRDVKGVDNFLYAFSPGGGFGGNADTYLRTYPGDEFIDVLGYDSYDDGNAGAAWLNGIVTDLGMIADLADERGKISAFTEYGVGTGALKPNGENPNPTWYTDVLDAIKADPRASRSAYMATWANFGPEQYFVPYPATADLAEHELLPDFQAYEADPVSYFSDDLTGVFDRTGLTAAEPAPLVHLVSPPDGSRVASSPTTVRARVTGADPDRVFLTVGEDPTEIELGLEDDGFWWSGEWAVAAEDLDNSTVAVTVHVVEGGVETLTDDASVVLGPKPTFGPGVVDDFEGYGDDTALRSEYVQYNTNTITLETASAPEGAKAMRVDYDFTAQQYTGVGKQISGDWSGFGALSLWVDPDASSNTLVLQLQAGGVSYEAYPSLAGDEPYEISIPWADWAPAPWDTGNAGRKITEEDLANLSQFNVYINSVPDAVATSGSIVVDAIRATGEPPPPVFSDVPRDHPYYTEIVWLYEQGLVDAGDGTFGPAKVVKRPDVASLIYRYADADHTPGTASRFLDVPRSNALYAEIEWIVEARLMDTLRIPFAPRLQLFLPRAPLDRTSAAVLLHRLAGSPAPAGTVAFRDIPRQGPTRDAIAWAVETGVISPTSSTLFGALKPVARQDMAGYLYRYDALPEPLEPLVLYDFGDGTQGWSAGNGAVTGVDGALAVTAGTDGTWVTVYPGSLDLTGRSELRFDLVATTGIDTKAAPRSAAAGRGASRP